jgi:hypothetical protein
LDQKQGASLSTALVQQIYAALATRFDQPVAYIKQKLPEAAIWMEQWSKAQTLGGGDMMHAAEFVSIPEDHRDASFVRVCAFLSCEIMVLICSFAFSWRHILMPMKDGVGSLFAWFPKPITASYIVYLPSIFLSARSLVSHSH